MLNFRKWIRLFNWTPSADLFEYFVSCLNNFSQKSSFKNKRGEITKYSFYRTLSINDVTQGGRMELGFFDRALMRGMGEEVKHAQFCLKSFIDDLARTKLTQLQLLTCSLWFKTNRSLIYYGRELLLNCSLIVSLNVQRYFPATKGLGVLCCMLQQNF